MVSIRTKEKMTTAQIKSKAQSLGITPGKMSKVELIRAIQAKEGYHPCYGTSNGDCPQFECCFRADCFTTKG
jgi:hypothetical protein